MEFTNEEILNIFNNFRKIEFKFKKVIGYNIEELEDYKTKEKYKQMYIELLIEDVYLDSSKCWVKNLIFQKDIKYNEFCKLVRQSRIEKLKTLIK